MKKRDTRVETNGGVLHIAHKKFIQVSAVSERSGNVEIFENLFLPLGFFLVMPTCLDFLNPFKP